MYFHPGTETLRELCERMRMKFSAAFLQCEPSRRPAVTSLIAQHAMFEIRISSRALLPKRILR